MAFTNEWDNNQPPDSQAANQLGNDLRTLRTDVQQRMSAISGTDANRLAIVFEPAFNGVLYFATDTGNIYEWGGAWNKVGTFSPGATGQSVVPAGTVVAPGLTFMDGSTGTGLYSDVVDTIKMAIAGVKKIDIEAALIAFFLHPMIDVGVVPPTQADQSGYLVTTNFLSSFTQTGLKGSLGPLGGYIAFPKWLTGGVHQLVIKWGFIAAGSAVVFDATVPFTAIPIVVASFNASDGTLKQETITTTGFSTGSTTSNQTTYIAIGQGS